MYSEKIFQHDDERFEEEDEFFAQVAVSLQDGMSLRGRGMSTISKDAHYALSEGEQRQRTEGHERRIEELIKTYKGVTRRKGRIGKRRPNKNKLQRCKKTVL
jgi:hypothetical protein